eukprot:scaffold91611_cov10-Tisochrysis_lutea.AAC.1
MAGIIISICPPRMIFHLISFAKIQPGHYLEPFKLHLIDDSCHDPEQNNRKEALAKQCHLQHPAHPSRC